eukprot:scaffold43861_cov21-Tisochrysis_lutea.AAC.3
MQNQVQELNNSFNTCRCHRQIADVCKRALTFGETATPANLSTRFCLAALDELLGSQQPQTRKEKKGATANTLYAEACVSQHAPARWQGCAPPSYRCRCSLSRP